MQEIASHNAAAFTFEMIAKLTFNNTTYHNVGSEGAGHEIIASDSWKKITKLAIELYPRGPEDQKVWIRAGGDVSAIELNSSGKAGWVSALTTLKKGGGGEAITLLKLTQTMREDFPNNTELERLWNSLR